MKVCSHCLLSKPLSKFWYNGLDKVCKSCRASDKKHGFVPPEGTVLKVCNDCRRNVYVDPSKDTFTCPFCKSEFQLIRTLGNYTCGDNTHGFRLWHTKRKNHSERILEYISQKRTYPMEIRNTLHISHGVISREIKKLEEEGVIRVDRSRQVHWIELIET
jgi:uncharacterized CHY-type Zn-finger protein